MAIACFSMQCGGGQRHRLLLNKYVINAICATANPHPSVCVDGGGDFKITIASSSLIG